MKSNSKSQLPRMDSAQRRRMKKCIKSLCANYDCGNCLLLDDGYADCPCPQMISYFLLCKYFRNAVLPADKELCSEIFSKMDKRIPCKLCGTMFIPGSNRAKYCAPCSKKEQRSRTRVRVRRYRGLV